MIAAMRRLHERGCDSRGLVIDGEGAMLAPDCDPVHRTPSGFRCLSPQEAEIIQTALFGPGSEPGWLFEQTRRMCDALAQIYGLHLPIGEVDGAMLGHLAITVRWVKASFDPNQPRMPRGEPDAGQWTYKPGYAKPRTHGHHSGAGDETASADDPRPPGEDSGALEHNRLPQGGDVPHIPAEPPGTNRERNRIARQAARWLRRAVALGAQFAPEPRVRAFFSLSRAVDAPEQTRWMRMTPHGRSGLIAPPLLGIVRRLPEGERCERERG